MMGERCQRRRAANGVDGLTKTWFYKLVQPTAKNRLLTPPGTRSRGCGRRGGRSRGRQVERWRAWQEEWSRFATCSIIHPLGRLKTCSVIKSWQVANPPHFGSFAAEPKTCRRALRAPQQQQQNQKGNRAIYEFPLTPTRWVLADKATATSWAKGNEVYSPTM